MYICTYIYIYTIIIIIYYYYYYYYYYCCCCYYYYMCAYMCMYKIYHIRSYKHTHKYA